MKRDSIQLTSNSEDQTIQFAQQLAGTLRAGDVIALEGQLGAGKTCFVRGLAHGLGISPNRVSSPTFVLCQEYEAGPAALPLVHIDAYRIRSAAELETIGWDELIQGKQAMVVVEWASRIEAALPSDRIDIEIEHVDEHTRRLFISADPARLQQIAKVVQSFTRTAVDSGMRCRICGGNVEAANAAFPFCSNRCRLADLNRWFNEGYRTSRAIEADDELIE